MICACGGNINEIKTKITYVKSGCIYTINNIPFYSCKNCSDEYFPADVEFNVSLIFEKMEKGELANEVEYREMF